MCVHYSVESTGCLIAHSLSIVSMVFEEVDRIRFADGIPTNDIHFGNGSGGGGGGGGNPKTLVATITHELFDSQTVG